MLAFSLLLTLAPTGLGDDPQRVDSFQWRGFIPCAAGAPLPSTATFFCAQLDPNADQEQTERSEPELLTLTGFLEWTPSTPMGSDLKIQVQVGSAEHEFEGSSPIEFRLDAGSQFAYVDHHQLIDFEVEAADGANLVYQQDFTLSYKLYYGEHPPR